MELIESAFLSNLDIMLFDVQQLIKLPCLDLRLIFQYQDQEQESKVQDQDQ